MSDWQHITTAPLDGTEVRLRHQSCPGYDTTGFYNTVEDGWELASFFVNGNTMMMHSQPTHWAPLLPVEAPNA